MFSVTIIPNHYLPNQVFLHDAPLLLLAEVVVLGIKLVDVLEDCLVLKDSSHAVHSQVKTIF